MIDEYLLKPYVEPNNPKISFYILYKNQKSFFEEFINSLNQTLDIKEYNKILALMGAVCNMPLPFEKFHSIKPNNKGDRTDVWEFKSKHLRVYVIRKDPDFYIVMAGYKKGQDADIEKIYRMFNCLPDSIKVED